MSDKGKQKMKPKDGEKLDANPVEEAVDKQKSMASMPEKKDTSPNASDAPTAKVEGVAVVQVPPASIGTSSLPEEDVGAIEAVDPAKASSSAGTILDSLSTVPGLPARAIGLPDASTLPLAKYRSDIVSMDSVEHSPDRGNLMKRTKRFPAFKGEREYYQKRIEFVEATVQPFVGRVAEVPVTDDFTQPDAPGYSVPVKKGLVFDAFSQDEPLDSKRAFYRSVSQMTRRRLELPDGRRSRYQYTAGFHVSELDRALNHMGHEGGLGTTTPIQTYRRFIELFNTPLSKLAPIDDPEYDPNLLYQPMPTRPGAFVDFVTQNRPLIGMMGDLLSQMLRNQVSLPVSDSVAVVRGLLTSVRKSVAVQAPIDETISSVRGPDAMRAMEKMLQSAMGGEWVNLSFSPASMAFNMSTLISCILVKLLPAIWFERNSLNAVDNYLVMWLCRDNRYVNQDALGATGFTAQIDAVLLAGDVNYMEMITAAGAFRDNTAFGRAMGDYLGTSFEEGDWAGWGDAGPEVAVVVPARAGPYIPREIMYYPPFGVAPGEDTGSLQFRRFLAFVNGWPPTFSLKDRQRQDNNAVKNVLSQLSASLTFVKMYARLDELLAKLSLSTFVRPLSRAEWLTLFPAGVGGSIIMLSNAEIFSYMSLARFDESLYEPNLGYLSMSWALDEYIFDAHCQYAWLLRMYRTPDEFFDTSEVEMKKMFSLSQIQHEALVSAHPHVEPFYAKLIELSSRAPWQIDVHWLDMDHLGVTDSFSYRMRDAVLAAYHENRMQFGVSTAVVFRRMGLDVRTINGVLRYVTSLAHEPEDAAQLTWRQYRTLWGESALLEFVDAHPTIVLRIPFPVSDKEVKDLVELNSLNTAPFPLSLTTGGLESAISPIVVGWSWTERYVREGGNRSVAWFRSLYAPIGHPFSLLAPYSYDDMRTTITYDRLKRRLNDQIRFVAVL
jgi:hypothetical protein